MWWQSHGALDEACQRAVALDPARPGAIVLPEQTNHSGTLFGGQALALMDKAAFEVKLFRERLLIGERAPATQGRFVLMALDESGRPTPVPELASAVQARSAEDDEG